MKERISLNDKIIPRIQLFIHIIVFQVTREIFWKKNVTTGYPKTALVDERRMHKMFNRHIIITSSCSFTLNV